MKFRDLGEFVSFLEGEGRAEEGHGSVNSELEITEITDRMVKSGGPGAAVRERGRGDDTAPDKHLRHASADGAGAGRRGYRRAFGQGARPVQDGTGPPTGLSGKLHALGELMGLARSQPKTVGRAPCQEVVLTGDDVDLYRMPVIKCWPMDAGPFITLPLVISRDPVSGRRNVGRTGCRCTTGRLQVCTGRRTKWVRVTTDGQGAGTRPDGSGCRARS